MTSDQLMIMQEAAERLLFEHTRLHWSVVSLMSDGDSPDMLVRLAKRRHDIESAKKALCEMWSKSQ